MSPNVDEKVCDERTRATNNALKKLDETLERVEEKLELIPVHNTKIKYLEGVVYGIGSAIVLAIMGLFFKG